MNAVDFLLNIVDAGVDLFFVLQAVWIGMRIKQNRTTPRIGQNFHEFMVLEKMLSEQRVWRILTQNNIGSGVVEEWVNNITGQVVWVFFDPDEVEYSRTVVDIRSNIKDMVSSTN